MKILKQGALAAIFVALCASAAWAEEVIETEAVKVTVNRMEQELHETNVSAAIITAEDIRRDPAPTIADQLAKIPGVMISDGGMAGLPRVTIRGEGSSRVLFMIDGVKVSGQKTMSGTPFLIDTANIERIEVVKGPASVLYGSEAIGGVINIITKKGGDKPIGGTAQLTYDSSTESFQPYASVAGNYNGFKYRVSGNYIDADDRDTPDGKLNSTNYRHQNYSAYAGYEWDKGSVFASAEYFKAVINVPNAGQPFMTLDPWERETYRLGGELTNLSDILLKTSLTGYYQKAKKYQDMSMGSAGSPMGGGNTTVENKIDSYGVNFQTDWLLFNNHYVIFGADWNYDDLDALTSVSMTMPMPPPRPPVVVNVKSKATGTESNLGIFLQDEWSLTDKFKIIGGVRYTWVKTDVDDEINGKYDDDDDNWVGNVGVVYTPTGDLALRANISQGYNVASMDKKYMGSFRGEVLPNPDLKPEKSTNYEIGARYNSGSWNIDAALYYSDTKNLITTKYTSPSSSSYMYDNMDKAQTIGFELGVDYTFESLGLTPYVVFNWMQRETKNTTRDVTIKTTKSGYPEFSGQVGLKWNRELIENHTFFADVNYFWNGTAKDKSYYYSGGVGSVVETRDKSWGTVNLNLGFESNHTDCVNYFGSISLRNIFDKGYTPAMAGMMAPGFHAVITGGVTF